MNVLSYSHSTTRALYHASPAWLKTLVATGYGFMERRQRYGREYHRYLAAIRASQHWSTDRLLEAQRREVVAFVNQALEDTPYYGARSDYRPIVTADDISRFPIVTKDDVRSHLESLYSRDMSRLRPRWAHTSGTTGKSLVFPLSSACFQREYAFRTLHYSWGGVDIAGRDPVAFCSGHPVADPTRRRPPFWVHDRANNWLLMSSYHMTEESLRAYVRQLETFRPVMLGGYPSSLYLLALACREYGKAALPLRSVFTASETLHDFQRTTIQDVFGVRVFNWYGNSEMCANIVECEAGELHMKLEHSGVEILDENNQPCGPGQTGRLVCTGFGNPAFPLIRYDIGDVVTVSVTQSARCGRSGLLVDRIQGRIEDYVVTPDGRWIGRLDHLFKDSRHVREAQIVQDDRSRVVLRIVRAPEYGSTDEEQILLEAKLRLGNEIGIVFEYLPEIPRGRNGKFRFVESRVKRDIGASRFRVDTHITDAGEPGEGRKHEDPS